MLMINLSIFNIMFYSLNYVAVNFSYMVCCYLLLSLFYLFIFCFLFFFTSGSLLFLVASLSCDNWYNFATDITSCLLPAYHYTCCTGCNDPVYFFVPEQRKMFSLFKVEILQQRTLSVCWAVGIFVIPSVKRVVWWGSNN